MNVVRMKQLLDFSNIIRPEYSFDKKSANNKWDHTMDLPTIFANPSMVEMTCPLNLHQNGN